MITNMQLSDGTAFPISDIESDIYTKGQRIIRYKNGTQIVLTGTNIELGNQGTPRIKLLYPFIENSFVYCVASASMSKDDNELNDIAIAAKLCSYLQVGTIATWNYLYIYTNWLSDVPSSNIQPGVHLIAIGRWK